MTYRTRPPFALCALLALLLPTSLSAQPAPLAPSAASAPTAPVSARPTAHRAAATHATVAAPLITRPLTQRGRASFVSGFLSAPSAATPQAVGRAFIDAGPAALAGIDAASLVLDQTIALTQGHALRYRQRHAGLEVIGADTIVRVDERGQVRWVASDALPSARAAALDAAAKSFADGSALSPREVLTAFASGAGHAPAAVAAIDASRAAQAVIYAGPAVTAPRPAYRVDLPLEPRRMQMLHGYIDAHTGVMYAVDNRVKSQAACPPGSNLANVFPFNPVATPEIECVSLSDYLPDDPTALANSDVVVQNCVDRDTCRQVSGGNYHFCELDTLAVPDQAGDFTSHDFVGDTEPEDAFAEVQMFYHVNKVYEVARGLGGFDSVVAKPLTAMVNFRTPSFGSDSECAAGASSYSGSEPLELLDNALFVPSGGLFGGFPDEDSIIFGQGSVIDFSYDGDVIYHEFGHAVMDQVAPDLTGVYFDTFGLNTMPGGLHEGYADLMTMFVTNDPAIGEYAGMGFGGLPAVRNIANTARCPAGINGESHDNSLVISGAIWEARLKLALTDEDRAAFDRAIFAAQRTFQTIEDYPSAALKTLAELDTALGDEVAAAAEDIFVARGILGDDAAGTRACGDRTLTGTDIANGYLLFLTGTDLFGDLVSEVPAPVQFRYEATNRMRTIRFSIGLSVNNAPLFGPGGDVPEPAIDVRLRPAQALTWQADDNGIREDSTHTVTLEFSQVPDRDEGILAAIGSIEGPFEPGVYYLQLVNRGPSWIVTQLEIDGQIDRGGDDGGCRASVGSAGGGGVGAGLVLVLAALALWWRRRSLASLPAR